MVRVRPVTFWLALNVMVKTEYISPPIIDTTNAAPSDIISATAGIWSAAGTLFSYKNAAISPAMPPMYIMPGTPRLRLPDFSANISPTEPNSMTVPKYTAA